MDLRLNATRRSINFLVYLLFDLEAGRFILGENLLGASNFCAKICLEPSMHFQVGWLIATLISAYFSSYVEEPLEQRNDVSCSSEPIQTKECFEFHLGKR